MLKSAGPGKSQPGPTPSLVGKGKTPSVKVAESQQTQLHLGQQKSSQEPPPHRASVAADQEGFKFPAEQRRRMRKTEAMIGKLKNSVIKSGAKYTHLFVSRVYSDVSADDLKNFISEEGVKVHQIKIISREESRMKSFKVTIMTEDKENVMLDTLWPAGVACREFFERREKQF